MQQIIIKLILRMWTIWEPKLWMISKESKYIKVTWCLMWNIYGKFETPFLCSSSWWILDCIHRHGSCLRLTTVLSGKRSRKFLSPFWGMRNLNIRRVNWPSMISSSIDRVQANIETLDSSLCCFCCNIKRK